MFFNAVPAFGQEGHQVAAPYSPKTTWVDALETTASPDMADGTNPAIAENIKVSTKTEAMTSLRRFLTFILYLLSQIIDVNILLCLFICASCRRLELANTSRWNIAPLCSYYNSKLEKVKSNSLVPGFI
jgi:hypothetical protein